MSIGNDNMNTPETDNLARGNHVVPTEWAEQLERERDEARGHLENHTASTIHSCHDQCKRPMCVLRRERDEARKIAEKLRKERFEARKFASALHEDQILLLMENAKLRDIAERAINYLSQSYRNGFEDEVKELQAEVDQIKEGVK
jgi:hypothetical protein